MNRASQWIREHLPRVVDMLRTTFKRLTDVDASLLAGAMSFYVFLSVAPLVLASVLITGMVLGMDRAHREVVDLVEALLGPRGSEATAMLLDELPTDPGSWWFAAAALVVALFGASRAFVHLQTALNRVFGVEQLSPDSLGKRARLVARKRGLSIGLVAAFALTVAASSLASTITRAVAVWLRPDGSLLPSGWAYFDAVLSLVTLIGFLVVVFKTLPDAELRWKDAAVGAVGAGLVVVAVSKLLGIYLTTFALRSVSGAAATIVVTLLWLHATSLTLLFGASLVRASALGCDVAIEPEDHARRTNGGARHSAQRAAALSESG